MRSKDFIREANVSYAAGILLIVPAGDILRRRGLVLLLIFLTTLLTIPLGIDGVSLQAFESLHFVIGVFTVTPQIMMPMVADLAPPEKRAASMSIVASGLILGILVARVIAGLIANETTWHAVYYLSVGLQGALFILLWIFMPDYPTHNTNLRYYQIHLSMLRFILTQPLLVQSSAIGFLSSSCFTNFWTTVTFLLSGAPYYYSPACDWSIRTNWCYGRALCANYRQAHRSIRCLECYISSSHNINMCTIYYYLDRAYLCSWDRYRNIFHGCWAYEPTTEQSIAHLFD